MKMNSLVGLLKRAEANITIAKQALGAQDPYEAGEVHDELESIKSSLVAQGFILEIIGETFDNSELKETISNIEEIQQKLETMVDQLGEDYDYKGLFDGGE